MNDRYDRESAPGVPRWVKIAGIVVLLVAVLVVVMLLIGGGHGPSRHGSAPLVPGAPTFPTSLVEA